MPCADLRPRGTRVNEPLLASSFKTCVVFCCFQPRQGRQMLTQGEAQTKASETLGRLERNLW